VQPIIGRLHLPVGTLELEVRLEGIAAEVLGQLTASTDKVHHHCRAVVLQLHPRQTVSQGREILGEDVRHAVGSAANLNSVLVSIPVLSTCGSDKYGRPDHEDGKDTRHGGSGQSG